MLKSHVQPSWRISQFRHHALKDRTDNYVDREGQQQVLRATFPGIRDGVKDLIGKQMAARARKFHETHYINVKEEIERLSRELDKLDEPWVFRPK